MQKTPYRKQKDIERVINYTFIVLGLVCLGIVWVTIKSLIY